MCVPGWRTAWKGMLTELEDAGQHDLTSGHFKHEGEGASPKMAKRLEGLLATASQT